MPGRRLAQLAALDERLRPLQGRVAERLPVAFVERRLEGGREDVAVEDPGVRVVEDGGLDPPAQQRLGLAHEELVERVLAGHEHRQAVAAAPGASPLLAQARDRAREADRDGAVEEADVDAELERVGGRHAEQLALDQAPLDLPPLGGRVAGAVRREPRGGLRVEPLARRSGGSARSPCGSWRSRSSAGRARRARRGAARPPRARWREAAAASSITGGFQKAIVRSAREAPRRRRSRSTSRPSSERASSPGLAIVAEARRNCGSAP